MKNVRKIITASTLTLGLMFSLSSCNKDVEKRLEGEWDYVWTTTSVVNGEQSDVEKVEGKFTFNEDGTGKMTTDGESDVSDFEWVVDNNESVTMIFDDEDSDEGMSNIKWKVIENKRSSQKWEYSISGSLPSLDGSNINYNTKMKMDLKK
jgi:hypothetical protein